jgi:thiamine biosynthesis lipoprotein
LKLAIAFSLLNAWSFSQQTPIYLEGETQGTSYHITYYDSSNRDLQGDIEEILADFDYSVSTYNPYSLISRVNRNDTTVKVDAYFIACFNKAKEIWKNTEGAFDPTVYPLVNAWGFGPSKKQHIERAVIDSILVFVGFEKIELKGNKVIKKDPRVGLDFNAFAQGYSVDVIASFIRTQGITNFIVEIGGEVYAGGKMENNGCWLVGIEEPTDNQETNNPLQLIVELENKALATSGNYRKFIIENGVRYAHHIDPKTGYPAKNNLLSASIFAPECISSDANATGVLVMGLEKAKGFLEEHPELQAYLIYSDEHGDYRVFQTPGVKSMVVGR